MPLNQIMEESYYPSLKILLEELNLVSNVNITIVKPRERYIPPTCVV